MIMVYVEDRLNMVMPNFSDKEMKRFIEGVYREPYSFVSNNCIHKSIKIARKARQLGKDARLVASWSIVPKKILRGFPTIQPHMYVELDGERVDVSLDPHHEEIYCKNREKVIVLPIKLPKRCSQRSKSSKNV